MSAPQTHTFKPSILLVDDDPDIGIALGDWLHEEGYSVHIVHHGQAGIDALKWQTFHSVILDLGLPDLDGMEVLTHMRKWDPHLPIIILTAYSYIERPSMLTRDHGAFAFLKKPYNRNEIKSTLDRALDHATLSQPGFFRVSRSALS